MTLNSYNQLVSVIIPTYNGCLYVGASIQSALDQSYPAMEVIVIDDGSTDSTPDVLAAFGEKITVIRSNNGGTAAARNVGIRKASGEYIALLDHDDLWLPDKIEKQMNVLLEDPQIALCHTSARWFSEATGETMGTSSAPGLLDYHQLLKVCNVCCCTALFRRSVWEELGGFDETLRGTDDWDMWARIAVSHQVVGINEVLANVRLHDTNQGRNIDRTFAEGSKVVTKHRDYSHKMHGDCELCSQALNVAVNNLKRDYYVRSCKEAVKLTKRGKPLQSIVLRLRGFLRYPTALLHPFGKSSRS